MARGRVTRGSKQSSRLRPPRQLLAPEAASQPLRPPSDEQEGASRRRQDTKSGYAEQVWYIGGAQHEQASTPTCECRAPHATPNSHHYTSAIAALTSPRRSADTRSAQNRLSIDAEKHPKTSPSASTSRERVLTANITPPRPLRARPALSMPIRCVTGAEMRSETSAPKAGRLTAKTRQNNT